MRVASPRCLRTFDIALSAAGLVFGIPLLVMVAFLAFLDTGSPIFRQQRVGRDGKAFTLFKFRTMKTNTPSVASHLVSASAITPLGRVLRRTKLDELPQLWNVLRGDMSMVGPRPCLYSQTELIAERERRGVGWARPGITGLAQIRGIDMSNPQLLAETDAAMLAELTIGSYFRYILLTVLGRGSGDRVRIPAVRDR